MKLAIVGSREFPEPDFVRAVMNDYFALISVFISGGADGVDSIAEDWVNQWNDTIKKEHPESLIAKVILEPDWTKYGKKAGAVRNQMIVNNADHIIAFWDGKSPGTKITIDMAMKAKKSIDIYVRQNLD